MAFLAIGRGFWRRCPVILLWLQLPSLVGVFAVESAIVETGVQELTLGQLSEALSSDLTTVTSEDWDIVLLMNGGVLPQAVQSEWGALASALAEVVARQDLSVDHLRDAAVLLGRLPPLDGADQVVSAIAAKLEVSQQAAALEALRAIHHHATGGPAVATLLDACLAPEADVALRRVATGALRVVGVDPEVSSVVARRLFATDPATWSADQMTIAQRLILDDEQQVRILDGALLADPPWPVEVRSIALASIAEHPARYQDGFAQRHVDATRALLLAADDAKAFHLAWRLAAAVGVDRLALIADDPRWGATALELIADRQSKMTDAIELLVAVLVAVEDGSPAAVEVDALLASGRAIGVIAEDLRAVAALRASGDPLAAYEVVTGRPPTGLPRTMWADRPTWRLLLAGLIPVNEGDPPASVQEHLAKRPTDTAAVALGWPHWRDGQQVIGRALTQGAGGARRHLLVRLDQVGWDPGRPLPAVGEALLAGGLEAGWLGPALRVAARADALRPAVLDAAESMLAEVPLDAWPSGLAELATARPSSVAVRRCLDTWRQGGGPADRFHAGLLERLCGEQDAEVWPDRDSYAAALVAGGTEELAWAVLAIPDEAHDGRWDPAAVFAAAGEEVPADDLALHLALLWQLAQRGVPVGE